MHRSRFAAAPDLAIDADGLAWNSVLWADSLDRAWGQVPAGGGSRFSVEGTCACLAGRASMTSLSFTDDPGVGEAWWFVFRPRHCGGAGSYDAGDPAQTGARDAGRGASPSVRP